MTMSIYFVEVVVLTALTSGSFGQLLCRLAVVRLGGGQPVGWARSIGRTVGVCLVIPALVIGANRRGLHDLALGTIVINRR